jgi:hypothetical protein
MPIRYSAPDLVLIPPGTRLPVALGPSSFTGRLSRESVMATKRSSVLSRIESPQEVLGRLRSTLERIHDIFNDDVGLIYFKDRDYMTLTVAERDDLQTELWRLHREMGKAVRAIRKAIKLGPRPRTGRSYLGDRSGAY